MLPVGIKYLLACLKNTTVANMSPFINTLLLLFSGLYLILLLVEGIITRSGKRVLIEAVLLCAFLFLLNRMTGFPVPSSRQAFGGVSPLTAIGVMFVCTMLGIMAHYIFYLKGKFSWQEFLKPLVISPIIFLPLVGSVQSLTGLEPVQMISFAILAFQNGFFWKEVFGRVKKEA
ncbi:MAG: hypothetical protein D3914_12170 [Candidatus Electrothrix sp. LOE2]|jgi:hypothetical protein|nr:hypothetical protein [Candidatus Electrothrix sp. LOE2]